MKMNHIAKFLCITLMLTVAVILAPSLLFPSQAAAATSEVCSIATAATADIGFSRVEKPVVSTTDAATLVPLEGGGHHYCQRIRHQCWGRCSDSDSPHHCMRRCTERHGC